MMELGWCPALSGLADNPALPGDVLDRFVARADARLCTDIIPPQLESSASLAKLLKRGECDKRAECERVQGVQDTACLARFLINREFGTSIDVAVTEG